MRAIVNTWLFTSDRATSLEVLDAQTDWIRARLEALNAHMDARVAHARLEYAIGSAMRESGPNA